MGTGNGVSTFFTNLNERLLAAGLPRWNIGPYPVEPIVSVAAVLAVMFLGLSGFLIVALLFFLSNMGGANNSTRPTSTQGGGAQTDDHSRRSGGRSVFGGSGHTLK